MVQYVINNTHHTSLKTTPAKLFLGFDQRNHSDCKLTRFLSKIANTEINAETSRYDARKLAIETIDKIKITISSIIINTIKSLLNIIREIMF